MIQSRWPVVALEEVLRPNTDWITLDPDTEYKQVTVRLWGKGVVQRAAVRGRDIAAASQLRVKAGQFIISRIDARNGAFGLVPLELDGAVVSGDFPCYDVEHSKLDASFLAWLSRTTEFVALAKAGSEGSTNRVRLKEDRFLCQRMPLPPVVEQKRITSRLDNAADRITKRTDLVRQVESELGAMLQAAFRRLAGHRRVRLSEVMILRPTDTAVMPDEIYQFAGVYSFGRGVFRSVAKRGSETAYQRLTRLRQGNFVYPKLMAWEGALGIVPPICDGCFVSPEFPVFEIDQDAVLPELLELNFRDRANWPKSTGTNVRRKRVHPEEFLRLEMRLPPLKQQEALAEACRKAAVALTAQRDAAEELDKLLPALLHEAFGEGTAALPRAAA